MMRRVESKTSLRAFSIRHMRVLCLVTLWLVVCGGVALPQNSSEPKEVALVGGTVIDGNGGPSIQDAVVLIKGDRIIKVGSKRSVKYPKTTRLVDMSGKFILPGLIDIHVHYNDWMGEMYLAHGVTTVKDVGNDVDWIATVSAEVEQGKVRGPRIFYVGNGLDTPPFARDHFVGLTSQEMAKRVVRILHGRGASAIKVREKITPELLRAITEEAHQLGIPVTGHLIATNAREAALSGIDGLEHASGIVQATADPSQKIDFANMDQYQRYIAERKSYALIDRAKARELINFLASKKVALIPTMCGRWRMATARRDDFAREDAEFAGNPLLAYVPDDVREMWRTSTLYKLTNEDDIAQVQRGYKNVQDLLMSYHNAGGRIFAGSDTFVSVPGLSLQREMLFLVDAGFTPLQAISIATRDNAQFLGRGTQLGTIARGKLADLLVVSADPLSDIRNLRRVAMVFKDGRVVDTSYHADYSIPTPRPKLARPMWLEQQLQPSAKSKAASQ